ncbi:alpha/beta fold hydrolase [Streptomyces sp. NPDC049813]|uniref:alpha/beta fold hydrolase n=1 Tax=Streptomyces sp. NPDC049813 TaxID=3365597 RepID=UPI0037AF81E5
MQKVVSRDGTTIAYKKAGQGPPLVMLGGGFRDHSIFDSLVPLLTAHCTTYVYDRRGRGQSGDSPHYAIAREVEDLTAVIEEAGGGEPVAVFGGSTGGILALETVLAGAPVGKLAVLEPPYRMPGFRRPAEDFTERLTSLLAQERRGEAAEFFLANLVGFSQEEIDQWKNGPMWAANEALAHTLPYDAALCGDGRLPAERFATIGVETLVIGSDHTGGWLAAAAEATAAAVPGSRLQILPGVWHKVPPEVLAPALVEFVTG